MTHALTMFWFLVGSQPVVEVTDSQLRLQFVLYDDGRVIFARGPHDLYAVTLTGEERRDLEARLDVASLPSSESNTGDLILTWSPHAPWLAALGLDGVAQSSVSASFDQVGRLEAGAPPAFAVATTFDHPRARRWRPKTFTVQMTHHPEDGRSTPWPKGWPSLCAKAFSRAYGHTYEAELDGRLWPQVAKIMARSKGVVRFRGRLWEVDASFVLPHEEPNALQNFAAVALTALSETTVIHAALLVIDPSAFLFLPPLGVDARDLLWGLAGGWMMVDELYGSEGPPRPCRR